MDTATARWVELLAQAIFHGLVASLFVEALVRSWHVAEPRQRMALRLVALGYPLFVFPLLVTFFPVRAAEGFRDVWAILVGRSFDELSLLGVSLFTLFVAAFAAAGAALFLMDLVPLVRAASRPREQSPLDRPLAPAKRGRGLGRGGPTGDPIDRESANEIAIALAGLPERAGVRRPAIRFITKDAPVLFCTGIRRHTIVVSRGAVRLLDRAELRAAFAHELAHLASHDPAASWVLMAARGLMVLNPAFQVLSRAIARDAEWLADDRAAALSGDRVALASALLHLHRATIGPSPVPRTLPFAAALAEPLERVRSLDVEVRCRRLLDGAPRPLPFGAARVLLAGLSLTLLLFFVV